MDGTSSEAGPDALSAAVHPRDARQPRGAGSVRRHDRRPAVADRGARRGAAAERGGRVRRGVAQRVVQLLLLRPQVLPRGLPGDAGDPQRVVDPDRVPRQRRGDGEGRAVRRGRRRGLRQLHPVRRLRAAVPQHPLHRGLLPVPDPDGRRGQGGARLRRRAGRPPGGLAVLERAHRRAHPRAGARRDPGQPGARAGLDARGSTCRSAARPSCSSTARPRSTAPRCRGRWPRSSSRPATSSA